MGKGLRPLHANHGAPLGVSASSQEYERRQRCGGTVHEFLLSKHVRERALLLVQPEKAINSINEHVALYHNRIPCHLDPSPPFQLVVLSWQWFP